MITIEQLIQHRRKCEKLVYRAAESNMPTHFGPGRIIVYGVRFEDQEPIAHRAGRSGLFRGAAGAIALVLLHGRLVGLVALRLRGPIADGHADDERRRRRRARLFAAGRPRHRPGRKDQGLPPARPGHGYRGGEPGAWAIRSTAAITAWESKILKDLGISRVRLLTNNPKKTDAFIYGGFELEVVDQVPIVGPVHEHNARYIATKRDKMGHKLP